MNLERCGDLARNIAKRSLVLSAGEPVLPLTGAIERMGRLVSARLREVLDAYAAGDVEPALDVWRRDGEVDEHYESLFRELLALMTNHPGSVAAGATCCSSPRTSNASAITPPTSPRSCTSR